MPFLCNMTIREIVVRQVGLLVLLLTVVLGAMGQGGMGRRNLAAFDTKQYHFGFALSGNSAGFRVNMTQLDSVSGGLLGIENKPQSGFNLAMIASWNFNKYFRVRFLPGLSFQDRALIYNFKNDDGSIDPVTRRTESVYLDFPLAVKLRTERVGNVAAYGLVGAKISKDMQSQEDVNQALLEEYLLILDSRNSSFDFGAGVDIFLPFFKFSIEGKFELGRRNVLFQDNNAFANPIESLRTRSFILSLCFEG